MLFRPNKTTEQHLFMQVKMKSLKQILVIIFFQFLLEMVNINPLRLFWSVKIFKECVWKTLNLWLGKVSPTERLERFTKKAKTSNLGISTVQKSVIWLIDFTCSVNEKKVKICRLPSYDWFLFPLLFLLLPWSKESLNAH